MSLICLCCWVTSQPERTNERMKFNRGHVIYIQHSFVDDDDVDVEALFCSFFCRRLVLLMYIISPLSRVNYIRIYQMSVDVFIHTNSQWRIIR